tara:strand:+ start:1501 stop:2121 length:621 start_codon:yes stop_codon:yes gene_type:complete
MPYTISHDNGDPICFVGKTSLNKELQKHVAEVRASKVIRLEDIEKYKSGYQYFCSAGFIGFKVSVIDKICQLIPRANFPALIHNTALVHSTVKFGRGCHVGPYAYVSPDSQLGDHVDIQLYSSINHANNKLGDLTYISPYVKISESTLAEGTWLGAYSVMENVTTVKYQQFTMNSRIRASVFEQTGTFRHNKLIDKRNSLEQDINR